MKHLTVDEILSFMQMKELTPSNIKFANQFNQHIYQCEQCRNIYIELCETVEMVERPINLVNEKTHLLQSCFKLADNKSSEMINLLKDKIKCFDFSISVAIESLKQISTFNLLSSFSFYHPVIVGVVKSTNSTENKEVTDVLIDDKYNRISISEDGTLALRFQKDICREKQIVFLIPENNEQEVLFAHSREGSDGLTRVDFFDITPGKYKIII